MTFWLIVGMVAFIWRATRLLVLDHLPAVRAVREWFVHTFAVVNEDGDIVAGRGYRWIAWLTYSIGYVWTCPWCMSPWVGLVVWQVMDRALGIDVPYPWFIIAAASLAAGWDANLQGEHDQRWKIRDIEINGRTRP